MAALHVADGVAAGLPGGEADGGQLLHDIGDLGQFHEVELEVLACGDVSPAATVVLYEGAQHVQLVGGHGAVGHLDAHHLVGASLTLAVDAVVEAEDAEHVIVDASGLVVGQHLLELGYVGLDFGVDGWGGAGRRGGAGQLGHRAPPCSVASWAIRSSNPLSVVPESVTSRPATAPTTSTAGG